MTMRIYWMGQPSEINDIRHTADEGNQFSFTHVEDLSSPYPIEQAELFLIFPSVQNPVRILGELTAKDRLLSIIVLADPARYNRVREKIQFSLFVGKSVSCLALHPSHNLAPVFSNAILRTRQRRTFSKFKLNTAAAPSELTAPSVKLDNLGNVLEHAPIAAMLLDKDLKVIGANKASRDMFSQLNEGQTHLRSVFPDKQFELIARQLADQNQSLLSLDDVKGKFFELSAFRYLQAASEKIILLVNDVTERRLKDKRIKDVLESLPQISWTASPDGELTFFSQGWYDYTNLSPTHGLGQQWISVTHPDDMAQVMSRWQESMNSGKRYQQASRFRRFDGQYRWHLSRAVPIYSATREIQLWVGTSTDIHEHVLLTENLERKVSERTRSLEEKNAELEQFAYISSHDLQEPLRKIQTFAHILKDEREALSAEMQDRYIDKIITTSARMSKLLRDLLNFTKINEQEPEQTLDLNDVMHQILDDLEVVIQQNEAIVQVADLPVVKGRPLQIKQLFYNILNNSLKFRKPDIQPRITITSGTITEEQRMNYAHLSPGREYCEIVVADNGIGFDQKYADQIFTVFQRLHSKSAYEGTGIGLSIARKVVTNHGGDIFAISSVGNGAEFHVVFPVESEK